MHHTGALWMEEKVLFQLCVELNVGDGQLTNESDLANPGRHFWLLFQFCCLR